MFIKLDTLLNDENLHVNDEEVIQAFKNLGYTVNNKENQKLNLS